MLSGTFYMPRQTVEKESESNSPVTFSSPQETPVATKDVVLPVIERVVSDWNVLVTGLNFTAAADKVTKDHVVQALITELIRAGNYRV